MKITKNQAKRKIHDTKGKIFSCKFFKKNGEERKLTGRTQVAKYVTGVGLSYNPEEYNLIVVFDMNKNGYRMVNINSLFEFSFKGQTWEVK